MERARAVEKSVRYSGWGLEDTKSIWFVWSLVFPLWIIKKMAPKNNIESEIIISYFGLIYLRWWFLFWGYFLRGGFRGGVGAYDNIHINAEEQSPEERGSSSSQVEDPVDPVVPGSAATRKNVIWKGSAIWLMVVPCYRVTFKSPEKCWSIDESQC